MNQPAASREVSVRNSIYEFDATLSHHPHRGHGMPCPYGWNQRQDARKQSFEEFFSNELPRGKLRGIIRLVMIIFTIRPRATAGRPYG